MDETTTTRPVRARVPENARGTGAGDAAPDATPASMLALKRAKRRAQQFTIPTSARKSASDPASVVLVELTAGELEAAYEAAGGSKIRIAGELARASLLMVDGRFVDAGAGDADVLWAQWSAKVRSLLVAGYDAMHNSSAEEDRSFLDSAAPFDPSTVLGQR